MATLAVALSQAHTLSRVLAPTREAPASLPSVAESLGMGGAAEPAPRALVPSLQTPPLVVAAPIDWRPPEPTAAPIVPAPTSEPVLAAAPPGADPSEEHLVAPRLTTSASIAVVDTPVVTAADATPPMVGAPAVDDHAGYGEPAADDDGPITHSSFDVQDLKDEHPVDDDGPITHSSFDAEDGIDDHPVP